MNLNRIVFNEDLTVKTKTEQPIRAYAQQANTIEVLAPVSGFNTAYIVLQGLANSVVNPRLRATQRLFMSPLTAEGDYSRWNMIIPGPILNDMSLMNSTGVRVRVEFWYISGDCLGVEKYNTEVTLTIKGYLAADYPDATDGQFVRVIDTNTDWYYDADTLTWVDYESQYQVGVSVQPTSSVDFLLEKGIYTDAPSHAPTNTELILQELAAKLGLIGGTMSGDIDMDDNDVNNVKTVVFYNALGTAVLSFDGTNLLLNRNAVDEEVMTVLNEIGDLANVVITSATNDDVLVHNGTNWVNITKTLFLKSIQDQIDPIDTTYLKLAGGTMAGAIAMGSNKITGLADGTNVGDAVNKGQMDTAIDTDVAAHNVSAAAHTDLFAAKADLVGGKVPASQVPNAYDDFAVYATYALLEAETTLSTAVLYIVTADETSGSNTSSYRWTGSSFVKIHDQLSASEVKSLYESNADTNAYTDIEKLHLAALPADAYSKTEMNDGTIPEITTTTQVTTPKVILATGVYIEYDSVNSLIKFVIE